jgi:hypothetical protein
MYYDIYSIILVNISSIISLAIIAAMRGVFFWFKERNVLGMQSVNLTCTGHDDFPTVRERSKEHSLCFGRRGNWIVCFGRRANWIMCFWKEKPGWCMGRRIAQGPGFPDRTDRFRHAE